MVLILSGNRVPSTVLNSVSAGYRYIIRTPGVCGGHPRVEDTRVTVHDVVSYHLLGCSVEEIADRFDGLSRAQIYECLSYYEDHRGEVEKLALTQARPDGA